ncbi:MAG: putative repeat protein (TIGR04052 family) [Alteromonadaceae bacterium]|jgi:uncharacterized repeat protein (TIGR04052 family)
MNYLIVMKVMKTKFLVSLIMSLISSQFMGCSEQNKQTEVLQFSPSFGGVTLNCKRFFNLDNKKWRYQQLQMYISDIELKSEDGSWQSWPMTVSNFQHSNIALIGENCRDNQDSTHWQIELKSIQKFNEKTHIRFTLGIPFELNHLNPLSQPSPLNDSSMFWVWQTGHKFLRLELASADDNWLFHLGSTGCSAPSVMRAPKQPCAQPNQVVVELPFPKQKPRQSAQQTKTIQFDLSALLQDTKVTMKTSCQSAIDDENCIKPLSHIGVTNQQKVFSIDGK